MKKVPEVFSVILILLTIHLNFNALKILTPAELEKNLTQLILKFGNVIKKKMVLCWNNFLPLQ